VPCHWEIHSSWGFAMHVDYRRFVVVVVLQEGGLACGLRGVWCAGLG
jgi:hypothetical protein